LKRRFQQYKNTPNRQQSTNGFLEIRQQNERKSFKPKHIIEKSIQIIRKLFFGGNFITDGPYSKV